MVVLYYCFNIKVPTITRCSDCNYYKNKKCQITGAYVSKKQQCNKFKG